MAACIEQSGQQQQQQQQQPSFKHYCRVCKKGFMCGRALGGHMRAHGIGDESAIMDDDDDDDEEQASDREEHSNNKVNEGGGGSDPHRTSIKRMYQLRANPNRLKSVRVCENCGKEFFSWKSFLEHGKCSSDDAESPVSSHQGSEEEDDDFGRCGGQGWSKRKRSLRAKVGSSGGGFDGATVFAAPSSEEEDILLARCLIDLANARVDNNNNGNNNNNKNINNTSMVSEQEAESSAASVEERRYMPPPATFVAPLASRPRFPMPVQVVDKAKGITSSSSSSPSKGLFECKACKKVFTSHQALGGHRASHKKVKGCYAAKQDHIDNDGDDDLTAAAHDEYSPSSNRSSSSYHIESGGATAGASRRKPRDHECSICHRVFSTGQALGGHKRCHWITTSNSYSHAAAAVPKFHFPGRRTPAEGSALDLNLPANGDDMSAGIRRDPRNPLSFEVSTDVRMLTMWSQPDDNNDYYNNDNYGDDNINKAVVVADVVAAAAAGGGHGGISAKNEEGEGKKVEIEKLSEMKEMSSVKGNDSPWLQVGIGSTTEVVAPILN
ncbi:hypothetical protein DM860_016644 [Cuscuta australis]|uniref:C2H2-type domain-containing protein n=1 Tax=Cuscuta australis TaxID=267555 RepID=A0A328DPP4_9ASTE|nr:hypothetical protein DM860_016644 [Cuscuta australis]